MDPLDDVPINHRNPGDVPGSRRRLTGPAVAALLLLGIVIGAGVWLVWRPGRTPPTRPAAAPVTSERPAPVDRAPLGAAAEDVEVPPLDLSDPFVRDLLRTLSSRPELAAWLATEGLVRNVAVSVENVANGITPSRHLPRLAPGEPFRVEERETGIVADARSHRRYDGIADTVASLDPQRLAEIYSILKPRLQEAYRELGHPDEDFDAALERAIVRLLETPAAPADVPLRQGAVTYRFEQAELERLSAAQKQLLRMGPRNARIVQERLRAIANALGIPEERLPPRPVGEARES